MLVNLDYVENIMIGKSKLLLGLAIVFILAYPYFSVHGEQTAPSKEWFKKHCHPFNSSKVDGDFTGFECLKDIIGDAHIVGLGEATHGTKEFFNMKHKIFQYYYLKYLHKPIKFPLMNYTFWS